MATKTLSRPAKKAASKTPAKTTASRKPAAKKQSTATHASALQELFENELKDIYWAEKALTKALPKMAKKATTEELRSAIEEHLSVTEGQIARLEQVFEIIGVAPRGKKCEAMAGLVKEAEEIMKEAKTEMARDAGIISAAQKVEHYEIASYGTLCAFAKVLGFDDAAELLEETLNEEKDADTTLTGIAESSINLAADEEGEESEDEDEEEDEDEDEEEEEDEDEDEEEEDEE